MNWILSQYNSGAGGILGDEMGLGKTIQTLSFISALKAAGQPGPHLVVTPLAVLINWTNEIKKFTPGLSFCKIHGSQDEVLYVLLPALPSLTSDTLSHLFSCHVSGRCVA
eukprot:SAG31_NODE_596_length_13674_cov_3.806409_10_plen_110_part_00